jgi:hypothetical protein
MYGEIAPTLVNQFMDKIREGKVYEIRRFLVGIMKGWYRPVDGEFMIRFGRYTTVHEIGDNVMDYPLCTYNLTPIDALPSPTDNPVSFTGAVIYFFWVFFFCPFASACFYTKCAYCFFFFDLFFMYLTAVLLYVDVIGIVTGVSPTSQYHSSSRTTPSTKRVVYISDIR